MIKKQQCVENSSAHTEMWYWVKRHTTKKPRIEVVKMYNDVVSSNSNHTKHDHGH